MLKESIIKPNQLDHYNTDKKHKEFNLYLLKFQNKIKNSLLLIKIKLSFAIYQNKTLIFLILSIKLKFSLLETFELTLLLAFRSSLFK